MISKKAKEINGHLHKYRYKKWHNVVMKSHYYISQLWFNVALFCLAVILSILIVRY